ncbi:RING finger and transmembrane domain-containing protein 2 [Pseudomyrmex gracilis]|uniref:RING finger and transmembrane domain-containing protein 2 n=1 Tax=Pseudomyrmex gracilis TaxID=219809 RepID=UPI000995B26B|nr:RING finger and transmembrane domain-containing protein 2 [Pseudomyrmex gracilis]
MAENRPIGQAHIACDVTIPQVPNLEENGQIQESSNNVRYTLPNINQIVRTAEHSRLFTSNISSTIRPLIQQAPISFTSLLTIPGLRRQADWVASPNDNYIINLEHSRNNTSSSEDLMHNHHRHHHHHHHHSQRTASNDFSNNMSEAMNQVVQSQNNNNDNINTSESTVNNNNNNDNNNVPFHLQNGPVLRELQRYIPFVIILLAKGLYDHRAAIFMYIVLLNTFIHANSNLKREIAKNHNRSWFLLMLILCYITACIMFVSYMLDLHTLIPYAEPLTIWDLLCFVTVMDYFLKLITVFCKVLLTCLPVRLLAFQNRGKYYLMLEATSQVCRCIAPIQPWLYYLFETYQGSEKIIGIIFSAIYTMSKGNDILSRFKLFRTALWKFFKNMKLGVSPTKEQLIASGGICAICHEEYSVPVRLHCKHIFCEMCVSTWLDRERSCPLCRASITDDPIYQDGHTTHFIQLY